MSIREDIHVLVAAQLDRTDRRVADPIICDYLSDLTRLFVNLLEEETRFQHEKYEINRVENMQDWQARIKRDQSA